MSRLQTRSNIAETAAHDRHCFVHLSLIASTQSRPTRSTLYKDCRKPAIWKRIVSLDVVLDFNKFVMENIGTREYTVLLKGSGFVYAMLFQ